MKTLEENKVVIIINVIILALYGLSYFFSIDNGGNPEMGFFPAAVALVLTPIGFLLSILIAIPICLKQKRAYWKAFLSSLLVSALAFAFMMTIFFSIVEFQQIT